MSIRIGQNETRYNTADLQAIADRVDELVPTDKRVELAVGYGGEKQVGKQRYRWGRNPYRDGVYTRSLVRLAGKTLRIASVRVMEEELEPAVLLASVGQERLPNEMVADIAEAIRRSCGRWTPDFPTGAEHWTAFDVRIEKNVQTPPDRRKRTPREKIQTLYEQYGDGGVMSGSSRTSEWHWKNAIENAAMYYRREYDRRDAWREKLVAAGETPPAYETFADFLRRKADEWERRGY